MQLTLTPTTLQIHLTGQERLWAFHLGCLIEVPLTKITRVTTELPVSTWREIRAPGTYLPGVIKAGTYYTERGREFWYVTDWSSVLHFEIQDDYYQEIILTVADHLTWVERIRQRISPPIQFSVDT